MTSPLFLAALFRIVSMLLELIVFGMIAAWIWAASCAVRGRPLLTVPPFGPPRPVTWGPGTLLALVILYFASQSAAWAGYRALVGVDLGEVSARYQEGFEDRNAAPADGPKDAVKARRIASDAMHLMAWNATFSALFLTAFPWVFRRTSGARLVDLGLTPARWPEQIQVGIVAGLLVAPAVYVIHALALKAYPPRLHPVQQMLEVDFNPAMAAISILSAVILAPIFEETLFRGVLQGWLGRVFREMADVSSGRTATGIEPLDDASEPPATAPPEEAGPSAVLLTAALFAAVHYAQWPTPIPLFVLAVVMGWLRRRTGSLLVPIVVHALFNGCSTLAMLASQLGGAAQVKAPEAPVGALLTEVVESLISILR